MQTASSAEAGKKRSHRNYLAGYLFLWLLAACGGGPALSPVPPEATILAFGDSLTYGTGAARGQSYPAVLADLTGMKVINAGVPGETSAGGRERLPAALSAHEPALVILVHGGNDTLRRLSEGATEANLLAMVEASHDAGAQVAMLGVPGRSLMLSAPDYYERVAERSGVPIDPSALPRLLRDTAMKSDAVHLNAMGYRRMAVAIRELLRESGALQ